MITIRGKVTGGPETASALSQLPSLLQQAGMKAMTAGLQLLSKTVREKYLAGPYPEEIQSRTGSFRATFQRGHRENIFQVESRGTQIIGTFGSRDIRAQVLNDGTGFLPGGVIKPKGHPYLAIPTSAAKTASGGRLQHQYANRPLREVPDLFPYTTKKGSLALARRRGNRLEVLFILVRQVKIKGRQFLQKARDASFPGIVTEFQQTFTTVIRQVESALRRR
jgi:hypothetical protein